MKPNIREEIRHQKGEVYRYTGETQENLHHGQLCLFEKETVWSGSAAVQMFSYRNDYTNSFFVELVAFERDYVKIAGEYAVDEEMKRLLKSAVEAKNEIEALNSTIENYSNVAQGGALPNMTDAEIKLLAVDNAAPLETATDDLETRLDAPESNMPAETSLQKFDNPISLARALGGEIASYRNLLNEKKTALSVLKKRLNQLQSLKNRQVEMMLGFKDMAAKIEKVLTTINLYLGTGEEIVQIRHGAWASPDDKLAIRQLILFMDQESRILLDEGGMDFKNIQQFDEWLLSDPRHLEQILPESKGIVCLKPREERKEYSDSKYINDLLNARNVQTYVLIRHGDNLFRVTPDWEVGSRLFPSRHEFDRFFRRRRFVSPSKGSEDYVVTPESREFESAVKEMESANFHYRNSLVMIQGIIDRTGIFKDLQERGVNLLDYRQNQDEILYINDGDENYLLRNGQETFREYQTRLNSRLSVGNRVILGRYTDGSARTDKRIYPPTASYPALDQIYLLEKNSAGDLVIRYERTDTIYGYDDYGNYSSKEPERRASFKLSKNDKFILAYDLASADEMNEFINDRLSRAAYLDLLPLLKNIRRLKIDEEKEEEEFLLLIVGELMKLNASDVAADPRREARRLINWWKFKNRWHRSLKDDYQKAFRMIMKEYRIERQIDGVHESATTELISIEEFLKPATLFIGREKRRIVRFERADNFGTRLTRTIFARTAAGWRQSGQQKESFVLRRDLTNITELYAHADWSSWLYGYEVKNDFVSEDDARIFLAMLDQPSPLKNELAKQIERIKERSYMSERGRRILEKTLPIAVYVQGNRFAVVYYVNYTMSGDARRQPHPCILTIEFSGNDHYGFDYITYSQKECEEEKLDQLMKLKLEEKWFPKLKNKHYVRLYENNFAEIAADFRESSSRLKIISDTRSLVKNKVEELRTAVNRQLDERAKKNYLASFGDERNWEYFRRNAKIDYLGWDEVTTLASVLSDYCLSEPEALHNLAEKTLTELKTIIPSSETDDWNRKQATFSERLFALQFGDYILFPSDSENQAEPRRN